MSLGRRLIAVPDLQLREGVPINHLHWLSQYAMDKGPDTIVFLGDLADMPSLSSYDKRGSKSTEGRRVRKDVTAFKRGMAVILEPWAKAGWSPEIHYLRGNHEERWVRALEAEPEKLEGMFPDDDPFDLREYGVQSHPFLRPIHIDGVRYAHYFPHGPRGNVSQTKNGAPSAYEQVRRQMNSATAGHKQGLDIAVVPTTYGLRRGLIAGSFYLHNEEYMKGLDNYWRGFILKNNVRNGEYSLCEVDMPWLRAKYRRLEPPGRKVL